MSSDDKSWESGINEPPQRGSFSSDEPNTTGRVVKSLWQCPFCDHTLMYSAHTKDVAEIAANSHVSRQHKNEELIVIFPDDDRPSPAGAISTIWLCPFCEVVIKVPEDERECRLAVRAHLIEAHRYHVHAPASECGVAKASSQAGRDTTRRHGPAMRRWAAW